MDQQHLGTKLGPANGTLWHEKPCRSKSAKAGILAGLPQTKL
jgi:hypothetical protein